MLMAQVHKSVLALVFHAGFTGSGLLLFVGAWFVPLFDYYMILHYIILYYSILYCTCIIL